MAGANAVLLVDADIVAFAAASIGQELIKDDDGELIETKILNFQNVASYIDNRVEEMMEACDTTLEPFMFLTGKTNFRNDVATVKVYKDKRPPKPFHFENARVYIRSRYNTYVSNGCEADDLLAMAMTSYRKKDVPCILCTVDKDLLQVEGWHYRWETWNSAEVPVHFVDGLGKLEGRYDEGVSEKTGRPYRRFVTKEFKGEGFLWLMAQVLTGDTVDNIPGLEGFGAKGTFELLQNVEVKGEALDLVLSKYGEKYGDSAEERFTEQLRLVGMIRERDKTSPDGLKHWSLEYAIESTKN